MNITFALLLSVFQRLEAEVVASRDSGYITPSETKRAIAAVQKDFPFGIAAMGADALRYGLCSYDVKSKSQD